MVQPGLNLQITAGWIDLQTSQSAVTDTKIPATMLKNRSVISGVLQSPDQTTLVMPTHQFTIQRLPLKDATHGVVVSLKKMTITLLIPTADTSIQENRRR